MGKPVAVGVPLGPVDPDLTRGLPTQTSLTVPTQPKAGGPGACPRLHKENKLARVEKRRLLCSSAKPLWLLWTGADVQDQAPGPSSCCLPPLNKCLQLAHTLDPLCVLCRLVVCVSLVFALSLSLSLWHRRPSSYPPLPTRAERGRASDPLKDRPKRARSEFALNMPTTAPSYPPVPQTPPRYPLPRGALAERQLRAPGREVRV